MFSKHNVSVCFEMSTYLWPCTVHVLYNTAQMSSSTLILRIVPGIPVNGFFLSFLTHPSSDYASSSL